MRHARREDCRASQERASESIGVLCGPVFLGNEARSYEECTVSNVIPFEYQGHTIRFSEDGWINATDIAKRFGKEPHDWLVQRDSVKYLAALAKALGKGGFLREFSIIKELDGAKYASRAKMLRLAKKTGLVVAKPGGQGGTWLHPKLAVAFARWLDVDFAVWCDLHIDDVLRGRGGLRHEFDAAVYDLQRQDERGSLAGSELARHRWVKPPMQKKVERLRELLQFRLPLDDDDED